MIELHLVGYTAELGHLVLDLAGADGGRYRLVVDEDLFATIDELREERRAAGLPVGDLTEFAGEFGLSTDQLQHVQDEDAAAAVAAGQVSAGSAFADRVSPATAAAPTVADGWDEDGPEEAEPDAEREDDEPRDAAAGDASEEDPPTEEATPTSEEDDDGPADEVARDDGPEDDDPDRDDSDPGDGGGEDDGSRPPPASPPRRTWDFDEGAHSDGAAPPEPPGSSLASGWDDEDDRVSAVRVVPRPVASAPADEEPSRWGDDGLVARLLDEQAGAGGSDTAPDDAEAVDDEPELAAPAPEAVEPASEPASEPAGIAPEPSDPRGPTPSDGDPGDGQDHVIDEAPVPAPPTTPDVPDVPDADGAPERAEALEVPVRRDGDARTPPRPLVPDAARRDPAPAERPARRDAAPAPRPEAALSPAQIQGRLRAGDSVRTVARAAGVDLDWIRRWEAPILAERARVLEHARSLRLERPRLGRSSRALGDAVARNLRAKGVGADDIGWEVSRRRDGRWRVNVRYVSRGRKRSATWTYDADTDDLRAASDNAREIGFVRRRR